MAKRRSSVNATDETNENVVEKFKAGNPIFFCGVLNLKFLELKK